MMILDDFVMLGTTVPEPNSDGRVFVCSAGYSATSRCPCAGRTDAADMPTRCCARRQHDTQQRQAKED